MSALVAIAGATATGKSALAVAVARRRAAEIVRDEALFGVPADDAGGEDHAAGCCDAVCIAARTFPAGGKQALVSGHDSSLFRRSRSSGGQARDAPSTKSVSTCV